MCRPLDQRDDNALDEFWSGIGMMCKNELEELTDEKKVNQ